jgi:UDP-N-acetylmuramoyl-L-alanyl-D-glutamate--2,6-diaminopimelate ligase
VALGRVCHALAGNPSRELTSIGVTGSAGKTCVSILLASIFEAAGHAAGVMSSFGHSDSLAQSPPPTATPTTAEYADWLRRMQLARCRAAVLELPSQALAERRTSGMALDVALITNIKNDRPAEHNTAGAYQKIIRRILKLLKPGGVAIVNADDHRCRRWLSTGKTSESGLTYGIHAEADVTASVLEQTVAEQTFLLSVGAHAVPVRTRIIGSPHISNCLAAAAAAVALGVDLTTIVRGLEAIERLPARMERIECGQPFSVFIDAARGPESLSQTLKAVRQTTRGRVIAVYGASARIDPARRALIGRVLERGANRALLTSDMPRHRLELAVAHDYLDGYEQPGRAHVLPRRREAIRYALEHARRGDAVVLLGRDDGADEQSDSDRCLVTDYLYSGDQTCSR